MLSIDKRSEELSSRAALFRILARGFACPVEGHAVEIREALTVLDWKQRYGDAGRRLRHTRHAWQSVNDDRLTADYVRLFTETGPVSLHETAYESGSMATRAVALADISGLYEAFGFYHGDSELPDHLGAELAFSNLLLLKERYARNSNLKAQACFAAQTIAVFLQQHLGRWVNAFEQRIAAADNETPYHDLATLLAATVRQECRHRRVHPESVQTHTKHEVA